MLTFSNERILAIISKSEFKDFTRQIKRSKLKNIALISIQDPDDKEDLASFFKEYHHVLNARFWDVVESKRVGQKDMSVISSDTARKIKNFITANSNKRFLVHCSAGMSRSAAVAKAVICLLDYDNDIYSYKISPCPITEHPRYHYNPTVFDAIVKA